ncbi:YbaN family protein [uncultured Vibrio sp.]|uniref:YbaN family protein n=1 Tax=Vibrio sp. TaxID=678 RepID=UPI0029C90058|nr:YbaN family protein [uncultured Vibrio sp.]
MIKRYAFLTLGVSATGLGMVGVFLPLLPSVPFALLALYCFSVSSPRFQSWLLANRLLGPTLRNIKENRGLTITEKVRVLLVVWGSILATVVWLLDEQTPVQVTLLVIALIKTYVIARYKTRFELDEEKI